MNTFKLSNMTASLFANGANDLNAALAAACIEAAEVPNVTTRMLGDAIRAVCALPICNKALCAGFKYAKTENASIDGVKDVIVTAAAQNAAACKEKRDKAAADKAAEKLAADVARGKLAEATLAGDAETIARLKYQAAYADTEAALKKYNEAAAAAAAAKRVYDGAVEIERAARAEYAPFEAAAAAAAAAAAEAEAAEAAAAEPAAEAEAS